MFGIGGGEMIFIIFIALMLFGSDKIPTIARAMGKGMAQLKNATNEIKSEITKSAEANGLSDSIRDITGSIHKEVSTIKSGISDHEAELNGTFKDLTSNFNSEVETIKGSLDHNVATPIDTLKEDIEDATGPIKRQM